MAGASLEEAACGATLCRVSIRFATEQPRRTAIRGLQRFLGKELPQMTMYTPPGDDTSVLYFSRAGAELPPMSETDLQAMK